VVPVRSLHARPNPKYFGRRKGATWLNLINDQGAGTAGMVVSGTARDSLNAVDLLYRRDGGRQPQVLISDTGSYTDMVFGLLKLLGVAFRPELADLPDQKPSASSVKPALKHSLSTLTTRSSSASRGSATSPAPASWPSSATTAAASPMLAP
jgi:TnpA family transposase